MKQVKSSETYMIDPDVLRKAGVEKMPRNRDIAYRSHPGLKDKTDADRAQAYDELKGKIQREGFNPECPILIHLNRKNGRDQIQKGGGHHRLAIALELKLQLVPVRFVYEVPENRE